MSGRLMLLLAALFAFGALTALALMDVGHLGIVEPHFRTWGAGQVLADLVILAVLACVWMVSDASERGRVAWRSLASRWSLGRSGPCSI
jgi:uncharacterized membrane protein YqjE